LPSSLSMSGLGPRASFFGFACVFCFMRVGSRLAPCTSDVFLLSP
jgi:hypothetical protein